MLEETRTEPISGDRKATLGRLRKDCVPRYLYRAYWKGSGGGPEHMINNKKEIISHAHMGKEEEEIPRFYETKESELAHMVDIHVKALPKLTSYTSWTHSLVTVLSFANSLQKRAETPEEADVHIAMIDRYKLDDPDQLIWHVWNLDAGKESEMHEFLAYGRISGLWYVAVPLETLREDGLYDLFPELEADCGSNWGEPLRRKLFSVESAPPSPTDLTVIFAISRHFGEHLDLAMEIALTCCRPRPGFHKPTDASPVSVNREAKRKTASIWRTSSLPGSFETERWIWPGKVRTSGGRANFQDVRQQIELLRYLYEKLM